MWNFSLGNFSADMTIPHFASVQRIARSFIKNFVDEDNAIPGITDSASLPDVTFLSAHVESLDVNIWTQDSAVNISLTRGVMVRFNDYIAEGALSSIQIISDSVQAKGLVPSGPLHWTEVTSVDFGLSIDIAISSPSCKLKEVEQREFLAEQDVETGRCRFLYSQADGTSFHTRERLGTPFRG